MPVVARLSLLVIGIFLGSLTTLLYQNLTITNHSSPRGEIHLGPIGLINPLLDCPQLTEAVSPKKSLVLNAVNEVLSSAQTEYETDQASVFFRDLNNGPTFGINTQTRFAAASLLKVPIMIAYLKRLESEPGLFEKTIVHDPAKHINQQKVPQINPPMPLQAGRGYTVNELIEIMITESSNSATNMLMETMPDINVLQILSDMGVPLYTEGGDSWITVEDYASIFRILYNATYLDHSKSNTALKFLTKTNFYSGLRAGVDENIMVAHKFGERAVGDLKQFHDCGVIYYYPRPYLLCIMTKGKSQKKQINLVATISRAVFETVKSM